MVTQGNLLALGILFMDVFFFFFHFFSRMILLISFLLLQLEIEAIKFFNATISDFSLVVKGTEYDIFFLIYIIVNVGDMGDFLFLGIQA